MIVRHQNNKSKSDSLCKTGKGNIRLNLYGMPHQKNSQEDDHQAFIAIQLERYLKRKTVHRFCSEVEKDVILQIIADFWSDWENKSQLSQMDTENKISAFYHQTLIFPYFIVEEETLIAVDFTKKHKIKGTDTCPCGSRKSYRLCCGSISQVQELLNGSF